MTQPTYQTVKLSKGSHSSPADGVCVMELASMLAGESFSDHPRSVSPTIGAFLRSYNDMLDDKRRQHLYAYAAKVVGTVASPEVERARIERLLAWGEEMRSSRSRFSLARLRHPAVKNREREDAASAARYASQSIRKASDEMQACVLALIDELVDLGSADEGSSFIDGWGLLVSRHSDWTSLPLRGDLAQRYP